MSGQQRPCKDGAACNRRNKLHFRLFSHPPETQSTVTKRKLEVLEVVSGEARLSKKLKSRKKSAAKRRSRQPQAVIDLISEDSSLSEPDAPPPSSTSTSSRPVAPSHPPRLPFSFPSTLSTPSPASADLWTHFDPPPISASCVHAKKLQRLADLLTGRSFPLIILDGPVGCGKSSAVRALGLEKEGIEVVVYGGMGVHSREYGKPLEHLREWIHRSRSITTSLLTTDEAAPRRFRCLLVESLPLLHSPEAVKSFQEILYAHAAVSSVPLVIVASEGDGVREVLPRDMWEHGTVKGQGRKVCERLVFQKVAKTKMKKALKRLLQITKNEGNVNMETLNAIQEACQGDMRKATIALQMIVETGKGDIAGIAEKGVWDPVTSLFKAMGRILHCKRLPPSTSAKDQALKSLPSSSSSSKAATKTVAVADPAAPPKFRFEGDDFWDSVISMAAAPQASLPVRGELAFDVESVVAETGKSPQDFIAIMYHNLVPFLDRQWKTNASRHKSHSNTGSGGATVGQLGPSASSAPHVPNPHLETMIEDVAEILEAFSATDVHMCGYDLDGRHTHTFTLTTLTAAELGTSFLTRSYLYHNRNPSTAHIFHPISSPLSLHYQHQQHHSHLLHQIRRLGMLSVAAAVTELFAYAAPPEDAAEDRIGEEQRAESREYVTNVDPIQD